MEMHVHVLNLPCKNNHVVYLFTRTKNTCTGVFDSLLICLFNTENTSEMLANMSASSTLEEIYPAIAIATLMRIIRDPTLSQHHTMVVQAITFIFKSLGIKCVPYIQQVIPAYLTVLKTADPNFREVRKEIIICIFIILTPPKHTCINGRVV